MSAPTGCFLVSYDATCDWSMWSPPLMDSDFGKSPNTVVVENINGVMPSNALSGLTNSGGYSGGTAPQISFTCGFLNSYTMTLLSDSLSSNLSWVQEMSISDCYNMVINDGALSYMTGVTILTFLAGSFANLSSTAFSGMTNLQTLYLYATMPSTGIPSGLFSGLTALRTLDMSRTTMHSIPSGLFSDLKNLTTLSLEETGLITLPADLFYPLLSLSSLNLDTNSWVCDCSLKWLEEYLSSTGLTNATCGSPSGLAGYDLQRSIRSLGCSTTTSSSDDDWKIWVYALIGAVSLALIIATIAVICCCRNRRKLQHYKQSRKALGASNSKDEISHSNNWVAKTGFVPPTQGKKMYLDEETAKLPSANVSGGQNVKTEDSSGAWTHRMFRASRVSPSNVYLKSYRAQAIDSL